MIKKIAMAIGAILLTGVIAFCCGYSTAVLMQTVTIALGIVLFYGILTDIFVTKWADIKNQKWYYWTAIGVAGAGILVAFIATRFNSRLWTWIGYIIVIAGGLLNGLCGKVTAKAVETETTAPTEELK